MMATSFPWTPLDSIELLDGLDERSKVGINLIFKHSTRCSISSVALARIERAIPNAHVTYYLLDLLKHRTISQEIATRYALHHESPQVLVISNSECIYDESHSAINTEDVDDVVAQQTQKQ
jgi:bacillithiol system protein YtxJ